MFKKNEDSQTVAQAKAYYSHLLSTRSVSESRMLVTE